MASVFGRRIAGRWLINVGILVLVGIAVGWTGAAFGAAVPELQGRVNDYAEMIQPATEQRLESALAALEKSDATQIVVLTVPSLEGDVLEEFAIRVAETWKIGRAGSDNGAILLIAKAERRIRIEVGYGLEDRLTDLTSGRIIRNVIAPAFKMGRIDDGITAGVEAMIGVVNGAYQNTGPPPRQQRSGSKGFVIGLVVTFFLIQFASGIHRGLGAVAGGGSAVLLAVIFFTVSLSALLIFGLIGSVLGLILGGGSRLAGTGTRGGTYWGGGGFGGGGFGGGGFGGGGFSGGGGGFGGGGASGGW